MKLLKKMRYIFSLLLIVSLLLSVTPVAHGFITVSGGRQLDELKFLMKDIFKPQWKIGYRYSVECTPADRQNGAALEEAMSTSLRTWLKPLQELQLERPIVDKFVYELQPDFDPNQFNQFDRNQPEDVERIREILREEFGDVDLRVTFQCVQGTSTAEIGILFQPEVIIRVGTTKPTLLLLSTLTHEFGHAFGLADTYARSEGTRKSDGGLSATANTQPASVMAIIGGLHDNIADTPQAIGEDDKRGIIWLYRYLYTGISPDDCFFADYVYVERGCTPKHPLIFETKHNPTKHALQLLKDDPNIDINAQDASGMTALHYATMYEKEEVVKALLEHKEIDPSLKNNHSETPYDLALATGNNEILKLLPAPPRRKEDVNADGVVNILDLIAVAQKFGQKDTGNADVNGDGTVDIRDLVLVAGAFGTTAAAPPLHAEARLTAATVAGRFETTQKLTPHADYVRGLRQSLHAESHLTAATVAGWLAAAQKLTPHADYVRGLRQLQHLHAYLTPSKTELLANFPNPFNPETWLPYRLDKAAQVNIHIYNAQGHLVRTLALGSQPAGVYQDKSRAAYWDGRNNQGELVASGVYFYTLTAGEFTATRKMLIRK